MEERLVDVDFMFIPHNQPSEVADPGDAPFHLPASLVPSQLASILRRRFAAVGFVRTDQLDPSFLQAAAQRV